MDKIVEFQMSIFGAFDYIKPNHEIILKMIPEFIKDGMLPSSISMININNNVIDQNSRMRFYSDASGWSISFLPDRIDFQYTYKHELDSCSDINALGIIALGLSDKVHKQLSVQGYRMAVNFKFTLPKKDQDQLAEYFSKTVSPIQFYKENEINEYNVRMSSIGICNINGVDEPMNFITQYGDTQVKTVDGTEKRVIVLIDINTRYQKAEPRFDLSSLSGFYSSIKSTIETLISQVEG